MLRNNACLDRFLPLLPHHRLRLLQQSSQCKLCGACSRTMYEQRKYEFRAMLRMSKEDTGVDFACVRASFGQGSFDCADAEVCRDGAYAAELECEECWSVV